MPYFIQIDRLPPNRACWEWSIWSRNPGFGTPLGRGNIMDAPIWRARVLKTRWKHHKSKDRTFLHRTYTQKKFSTQKKYIFFEFKKIRKSKSKKNLEKNRAENTGKKSKISDFDLRFRSNLRFSNFFQVFPPDFFQDFFRFWFSIFFFNSKKYFFGVEKKVLV